MPDLPSTTHEPGWPTLLTDTEGNRYVLVRDGVAVSAFSGDCCLYARLDGNRRILRDRLYVPRLGSTADSISMAGGSWLSDEDAALNKVPPVRLPKEPVPVN